MLRIGEQIRTKVFRQTSNENRVEQCAWFELHSESLKVKILNLSTTDAGYRFYIKYTPFA